MNPWGKKKELISAVQLTSGTGQYFFGYYDVPAFSGDGRRHLAHRTSFMDRLQVPGDKAELGWIDLEQKQFTAFAETAAWNFQQGAMLQWNPAAPDDEVIYNVLEDGAYRGLIHSLGTGGQRRLERPVAAVDPLGRFALSINFSRMYDFRPGYGYADVVDSFRESFHSEQDGVFYVDFATGASKQILSMQQIWDFVQPIFHWDEAKMLINHITVNSAGTRFVFLARTTFPGVSGWQTALLTAAVDGSGLRCLAPHAYHSHYYWKDADHLLMYGANDQGKQLYLYRDEAMGKPDVVDSAYFTADGHCSYSPDRQWILYDSYPDEDSYRHLYLYHPEKKRGITLGTYYAPPEIYRECTDIRCDLHPRWNRQGTAISFDSMHEGQRHIYLHDLRQTMRDV